MDCNLTLVSSNGSLFNQDHHSELILESLNLGASSSDNEANERLVNQDLLCYCILRAHLGLLLPSGSKDAFHELLLTV